MVQTLTDWLKQSRLIVVAVEMDKGRVRVKGDGEVWSRSSARPGSRIASSSSAECGRS
jgi:membrane protein implicated in regulation of membrane protease activity